MKRMFASYPDIIFVDSTYSLNDLRMPIFVLAVEDGNGETEIVAVWVVADETKELITNLVKAFQRLNSEWTSTRVIMADKDFQERQVFSSCFPDAQLTICLFHVLRTFRREITIDKMNITGMQRDEALEIMQRLAYAKSIKHYDELYNSLKDTVGESIFSYFTRNWHPIKHQWVEGLKLTKECLLNSTNNRLESINQKLKSVIKRNSSLFNFFEGLIAILTTLRLQRDHRALNTIQKRAVITFSPHSVEAQYAAHITPFALRYVLQQLKKSLVVKIPDNISPNSKTCAMISCGINITVGLTTCECLFRKSMGLPCKHMLAFRNKMKEPMFLPDMCANRWSRDFYQKSHRAFISETAVVHDASNKSQVNMNCVSVKKVLCQSDRYKKAFQISQRLATLVAEAPLREFNTRLEVLKNLCHVWENNKHDTSNDSDDLSNNLNLNNYVSHNEGTTTTTVPDNQVSYDDVTSATIVTGNEVSNDEGTSSTILPEVNELAKQVFVPFLSKQHQIVHDIENVSLPPKIKVRGRPKGAIKTAIGLKRRRKEHFSAKLSNNNASKGRNVHILFPYLIYLVN